jgi:ankyrin repeat protein/L-ascorbate metabolism protein UlaG (beta-lactamase superfamily)
MSGRIKIIIISLVFISAIPLFSQDIFQAAEKGDLDMVKALLKKNPQLVNAKTKDDNSSPLISIASENGHKKIVEILIEKGADVNGKDNYGTPVLSYAAYKGHEDIVELLIAKGANINERSNNGLSALHNAAIYGQLEIMELLVSKGSDINSKDDRDRTPLQSACWSGWNKNRLETIRFLLDNGATVNILDDLGKPPLFIVISTGYPQIADLFISEGADVNLKETNTGKTPLHMAAIRGYSHVANLLITVGAEIDARDNHGNTPLDYALKYENQKTVDILLSKSGTTSIVKKKDESTSLLKKKFNNHDAGIWYLGHSGWGIKTGNYFLIFDFYKDGTLPDETSLSNGYVNPSEIKELKVYVFVSHVHGDHYNPCIFDWKDKIGNITYILGFQPEDVPAYEFIGPREKREIDGMTISTIESNDSGVGFLVEVNGLTFFHAGDHANQYRDFSGPFCAEIDLLSNLKGKIDIAFLPIAGCGFGDLVAVKKGVYYVLENLTPRFMFPMHAGDYVINAYRVFAENAEQENFETQILSAESRGDRFEFKNGRIKEIE